MKQIDNLTGLRAFAALSVVLLHLRYEEAADPYGPLAFIFRNQGLGVDVFFVLSGFILAYVHNQDFATGLRLQAAKSFLWARLSRIYPVHLFMLALTAGAMHWKPTDSIEGVFANLFLVHAWGVLDTLTFNTPSWTISAEWFAYLCFPLIAAFSRRLPWWCFIVPGIAAAYVEPSITTNSVAGGYWALKCLLLFISGFCWFRFGEHLGNSMLWRWGAILIGPFLIYAYWLPIPYFIWIFKVSLGFWILCLFKSGPVFLYANPVSVYLGKTSYSLYMTHSVAIVILTVKFGGVKPLWIEIPLLLAIASVVYHVIEEPARNLMRSGTIRSRIEQRQPV